MKTERDRETYIHRIRRMEIEQVMKRLSRKFSCAIELGAGDCFQAQLMSKMVGSLICIELDEERFTKIPLPNVNYHLYDAEEIDRYFPENSFDLIFSSNMFEHLPNPAGALKGIHKLLKDDGVVVLIMPGPFWTFIRLALHYPNLLITAIGKITDISKLKKFFMRLKTKMKPGESRNENSLHQPKINWNNIKFSPSRRRYRLFDIIRWPLPHGAFPSNWDEFEGFSKKKWCRLFEASGFALDGVERGPISSGYGFGLETMRKLLNCMRIATEYIYYLKKDMRI